MKNQQHLNTYFEKTWSGQRSMDYEFSGRVLASKVSPDEWVLDVGCGYNPFKGKIKNLVGIDPANDAADKRVSIEDYETEQKFDVAFCLGSINFGDKTDIERQIVKVVALLNTTARIYWRCNPGTHDHGNIECETIPFYPWTIAEHVRLSAVFGFRLMECRWDGNRIYAEWVR